MTLKAQQVAIAKVCGIEIKKGEDDWFNVFDNGICKATADTFDKCLDALPDYLNDLNAMHEAEKMLSVSNIRQYWADLLAACTPSREYWRATAAQRAEAFLRTLNLWEETT